MDMQFSDATGLKILPLELAQTPVMIPVSYDGQPQALPVTSSSDAVLDTTFTNDALASSTLASSDEATVMPAATIEEPVTAPAPHTFLTALEEPIAAETPSAVNDEADSTMGDSSANAKVEETSPYYFSDTPRTAFAEEAPSDAGRTSVTTAPVLASKAKIVIKALHAMEDNIKNLIRLLEEDAPTEALQAAAAGVGKEYLLPVMSNETSEGRMVEGVFDGVRMVGSDGNAYPVPPNYASKSKLVEGDMLKLTIGPRGNFIFKQVGPIERGREIGALGFDQTIGEFYVTRDDKRWNVLKASVTYYKGEPGDEAVVLVPKDAPAKWAAVENIIKKNPLA